MFPALGVGLLDFKLSLLLVWNSSPRPVYSSLIPGVPNPKVYLPNLAWSAQPRVSLKCPTPESKVLPESPWSAQPRVSPERPAPNSPWNAQPPECPESVSQQSQSLPEVPTPRRVPSCLRRLPEPRVSLPREGGDVRSKIMFSFLF